MLRPLTTSLLLLAFFAASAHAIDGVPPEITKLKGKRVRIHHNINLLGGDTPLEVHVYYLKMVMQRAGATVETSDHTDKKADLVIFGEIETPEAHPLALTVADTQITEIEKYRESRQRLEREALAAGSRVIHFPDVARALGIRVTNAQIVKQLDERAQTEIGKKFGPLKADAKQFTEMMQIFRDAIEADIYVDWKALEAIGVSFLDPVNVELGAMTVGDALAKVLDTTAGKHGLTYAIRQGTVWVTSKEALKEMDREGNR